MLSQNRSFLDPCRFNHCSLFFKLLKRYPKATIHICYRLNCCFFFFTLLKGCVKIQNSHSLEFFPPLLLPLIALEVCKNSSLFRKSCCFGHLVPISKVVRCVFNSYHLHSLIRLGALKSVTMTHAHILNKKHSAQYSMF